MTTTANQKQQTNAVATTEKKRVTYQVAGQEVTLSDQIVRNFLTKGNGQVTDQDITQFISICKYNELNPFLNEAYLIKFGNQPATMIVSKEAYFKRAEAHPSYEGIRAGVIVMRDEEIVENGQKIKLSRVHELEGCFYLPTDKLVGGWAEVHRSDRKFPYIAKVNLSEYDKGQSNWKEKPSTMISKVAKVQALREAFPAQLGAMYTREEVVVEDADYVDLTKSEIEGNANKGEIGFNDPDPIQQPAQEPEAASTEQPKEAADPNKPNGKIPF